jgi:hypothetical protein
MAKLLVCESLSLALYTARNNICAEGIYVLRIHANSLPPQFWRRVNSFYEWLAAAFSVAHESVRSGVEPDFCLVSPVKIIT